MTSSLSYSTPQQFLDACIFASKTPSQRVKTSFVELSRIAKDGLICEFGVYRGTTINILADLFPFRTIDGFDSFCGLPEEWRPGYPAGVFSNPIPSVRPNVKLHVGWFQDTLPTYVSAVGGVKSSLVHVDCDLYSSSVTCLTHLEDTFVDGTILVFDELWYPDNYKDHEYKALCELLERMASKSQSLEYVGNLHDESFAFVVRSS